MKLISWNIAIRSKLILQQLASISMRRPDILALQEVNANSKKMIHAGLKQMGLVHIADTIELGISN